MPHRRFEGADSQEASQFLCHDRPPVQRRSLQAFSRLRIRTQGRMPERASARLRLLEHAEPARSNPNRRFAFPSPRRIWQWPDRREPIVAGAVGPEVQTWQGTAFPARMARLTLRPGAVRNSPLDFLEKDDFPQWSISRLLIILPLAAYRAVAFCQGGPAIAGLAPGSTRRSNVTKHRTSGRPPGRVVDRRLIGRAISCDRCSASMACGIASGLLVLPRSTRAAAPPTPHKRSRPRVVFAPRHRSATRRRYRNRSRKGTEDSCRKEAIRAIQRAVPRHRPLPRPLARCMPRLFSPKPGVPITTSSTIGAVTGRTSIGAPDGFRTLCASHRASTMPP